MQEAAANDARLRFIGYVTGAEKDTLLASSHYLLIPSVRDENAPVAVIEAAGYGLAVIGSRIGGLPELIRVRSKPACCSNRVMRWVSPPPCAGC